MGIQITMGRTLYAGLLLCSSIIFLVETALGAQQKNTVSPANPSINKRIDPSSLRTTPSQKKIVRPSKLDTSKVPKLCADPSILDVKLLIVEKNGKQGKIFIKARIENKGNLRFQGNPDFQKVLIYEGAGESYRNGKLFSSRGFDSIGPGRRTSGGGGPRDWDAGSFSQHNPPPNFTAVLKFDSVLASQGNPENIDCDVSNNSYVLDGTLINDKFLNQ